MINIKELKSMISQVEIMEKEEFERKMKILYIDKEKKEIANILNINEHTFRNYYKPSTTTRIPFLTVVSICDDVGITFEEFMKI